MIPTEHLLIQCQKIVVPLTKTNHVEMVKRQQITLYDRLKFTVHSISENFLSLLLPLEPFQKAFLQFGVCRALELKEGKVWLFFKFNFFKTNKDLIEDSTNVLSVDFLPLWWEKYRGWIKCLSFAVNNHNIFLYFCVHLVFLGDMRCPWR